MFALTDYHFWIAFVGFILASFVSFYLPGLLVVKTIDKDVTIKNIILAFCTGFVMWTLQAYIFAYFHLRWLTYVYLVIIVCLAFPQRVLIKKNYLYLIMQVKRNKLVTAIILIGMVLQSQIMFGSGFVSSEGMRFLGTNYIDGLMHMAYIQKMITTFPPNEPGAYLLPLKNYHYWMDLTVAELARVWLLPAHHIFFQFIPLLFSVLTGMATYALMRLWTGSKIAGLWALFFLYLGGDGTYLFMLVLQHKFGFYTPAIDNGITQFYNMPHAAAKMVFMAGLIAFYQWIKTNKKKWGILTVFLFAPLIGYKIYFGLFAGLGMTFVTLVKALKRDYFSVVLLAFFALFAAMIYLPVNAGAGGLGYYPLEWPKIFLGQQNLDIREWWLRMQVYQQAGNIRNIIIYDTFAIIVTLICIHGTRLIGLIPHKKLFKLLGWEHMIFFLPGIVIFHILGLFTLQKSGSFNVFNFFVVSTVVMALFSSYLMYELTKKKRLWAYVLLIVIVALTIPRTVFETYAATKTNLTHSGGLISTEELDALSYLKNYTSKDAIVQSHSKNDLDETTTYVAYFSGRDTYISGSTLIESHGQELQSFKKERDQLFQLNDAKVFAEHARKLHISYIYLQKLPNQQLLFPLNSPYLTKKFENNRVIILEMKK